MNDAKWKTRHFIRHIFAFRHAISGPLEVLRIFKGKISKVYGIRFVCTT